MLKYLTGVFVFGVLVLVYLEYVKWRHLNYHRIKNPKCYDGDDFHYLNVSEIDKEYIRKGAERAQNSQIVIVGLAKDIRERLEKNLPRACGIGQHFSDYRVVVMENDSTDGTRELLEDYVRKNPRVERVPCCELGDCACMMGNISAVKSGASALSLERIDKMTDYRNQALNYIKKKYGHYEYMLVIDLDAEGPCPMDGIFHSLGHDKWDMIGSNGKSPVPGTLGNVTMVYDSLAYVAKGEMDRRPPKVHFSTLVKESSRLNWHVFSSDKEMIPVDSSFNGAALYKMESLEDCSYTSYGNCEHIGLHKEMIDRGKDKLYLNRFWVWYVGFQGPRDFRIIK